MGSEIQHRPHPADPGHPPESEGAHPSTIADALGTHSLVVKGFLRCGQHDQRTV
jgi:hypothetical protein